MRTVVVAACVLAATTVCGNGAAAECADVVASTSSICDLIRDARANPQQGESGIVTTAECTACPEGQFWDPTWTRGCRPHLDCESIASDIVVEPEPFATGGVKQIFRGSLRGFPVAVSKSKTLATQEDFDAGITMLQTLCGWQLLFFLGFFWGDEIVPRTQRL